MKKTIVKLVPLAYGQYYNLLSAFAPKKTADKAFHLFCTVRKGSVLPVQKEYLNTAKHELLNIGNYEIQTYLWPGGKETVLLIHGWESNTFRWRNLIEKLQGADFNIVAFDAPGHGNSSGKEFHVPLHAECLQHLIKKYDPKFLIAHSLAGMTALYNEKEYPESTVEKIVAIASLSEFHEIMGHFQNLLKFNTRVMNALDDYIQDRFGFKIREFSTSEFVKTNTKKGLLFHDRFDTVTPYHASQKIHAHWKNSKLVSTEGLGHSMHQEEINKQILEFLGS